MQLFKDVSGWFSTIDDVHDLADALFKDIAKASASGKAWIEAKRAHGGVLEPCKVAHEVIEHWYKRSADTPYGRRLYDVLCDILPRVAENFEEDLLTED